MDCARGCAGTNHDQDGGRDYDHDHSKPYRGEETAHQQRESCAGDQAAPPERVDPFD
jgi:hypothetical protein